MDQAMPRNSSGFTSKSGSASFSALPSSLALEFMEMYGDHPPAFGAQHPWHDPLAPQDVFNPRPDVELALAGSLAPRPEDFPFTEEGRRNYYSAVKSVAQQQMMVQQQQMHQMQAVRAAHAREEEDAARKQRASFLLLMSCP